MVTKTVIVFLYTNKANCDFSGPQCEDMGFLLVLCSHETKIIILIK